MDTTKLIVKILNETNSTVQEVDKFEFHEGEDRTLKLQIWSVANDGAYIIADPATAKVTLLKKTGFDFEKALTIDSANRSVVSTTLTKDETPDLITGDIKVTITEGGLIRVAKQEEGLSGMVLLR